LPFRGNPAGNENEMLKKSQNGVPISGNADDRRISNAIIASRGGDETLRQ